MLVFPLRDVTAEGHVKVIKVLQLKHSTALSAYQDTASELQLRWQIHKRAFPSMSRRKACNESKTI